MGEQPTQFTRYAILIGIDAYSEKPLKSCVRDVKDIQQYLEKMPTLVHIQMLTATMDPASSRLAEDPKLWPTYDNVTSSVRYITSLAKAGDFVYLHFSGHGTTREPSKDPSNLSIEGMASVPSKFSNPSTGDVALAILEVSTEIETRYLRGEELASLIKMMVNKGLIVTLVLDCCFSGSVVRDDSSIRYLKYDPKVDAAYPPASWLSTEGRASRTVYRNASMRSNWLIDPDGYTILTACGPTETTQDLVDREGQRHGPLSYFLLRSFAKLGYVGGQQRYIYSHLCARFQETRNQRKNEQNPMIYGNKKLGFFGPVGSNNNFTPIPIVHLSDHGLRLQAGHAHGICSGDHFSVCSLRSAHDPESTEASVIARVTHVKGLTSDLEMRNKTSVPSESGLTALALSHLSLRRFPVRLELGLPYPGGWTRALKDRPSLDIYDNNHTKPRSSFSFYVAVTDDNSYEIRDESNQRIPNLPTPAHDLGESVSHILDMIEHLAMFKMVKILANNSLANTAHSFNMSFDVKLINPAGKEFDPGCFEQCNHTQCLIEAKPGEKLELVVRNQGHSGGDSLYLHILNLGPNWDIEDILHSNHEVLSPRYSNQHMEFHQGTTGVWRKKLEMQVPPKIKEMGHLHYEDIIKVFLTVQPTSFMLLELPAIGEHLDRNGHSRIRGDGGGLLSEDWAALNFRIRSKVK